MNQAQFIPIGYPRRRQGALNAMSSREAILSSETVHRSNQNGSRPFQECSDFLTEEKELPPLPKISKDQYIKKRLKDYFLNNFNKKFLVEYLGKEFDTREAAGTLDIIDINDVVTRLKNYTFVPRENIDQYVSDRGSNITDKDVADLRTYAHGWITYEELIARGTNNATNNADEKTNPSSSHQERSDVGNTRNESRLSESGSEATQGSGSINAASAAQKPDGPPIEITEAGTLNLALSVVQGEEFANIVDLAKVLVRPFMRKPNGDDENTNTLAQLFLQNKTPKNAKQFVDACGVKYDENS
ncbi:MAG: hypothetical protein ACXWJZ_15385 [Burkholderiaceae bacterium]